MLGRQRQEDPWASWLTSLANQQVPGSVKDLVSRNQVGNNWERHPMSIFDFHMQVHKCACVLTCTHTKTHTHIFKIRMAILPKMTYYRFNAFYIKMSMTFFTKIGKKQSWNLWCWRVNENLSKRIKMLYAFIIPDFKTYNSGHGGAYLESKPLGGWDRRIVSLKPAWATYQNSPQIEWQQQKY